MKRKGFILIIFGASLLVVVRSNAQSSSLNFDFYGDSIELPVDQSFKVDLNQQISEQSVQAFVQLLAQSNYQKLIAKLVNYQEKYKLDDWLYYQLIRKTAQQISPKQDNYFRYTAYKWFFLTRSGYNASLSIHDEKLLLYVQSDENIYEIPCHTRDGKQFVCLNYHDYSKIDFTKEKFLEIALNTEESNKSFSYKVTQLPNFAAADYIEKEVEFNVYEEVYQFKLKLNRQVQSIFANYPVVDYASYFNIPLSQETYSSLIPLLKENIKGLSVKDGVDHLMRFTRYAFLFETDTENFGKEKRLIPEQTLLYDRSDCEDRAALFFYLVKEIYQLPMIVLSYPKHVTIAVKFDNPIGHPIMYNGEQYSVCEPTPQKTDLPIGKIARDLRNAPYEIVYAFHPQADKK